MGSSRHFQQPNKVVLAQIIQVSGIMKWFKLATSAFATDYLPGIREENLTHFNHLISEPYDVNVLQDRFDCGILYLTVGAPG